MAVPARLGVGRDAPPNPEYYKQYRQKRRSKTRAYSKLRYHELKAAGVCVRCKDAPSLRSKTMCDGCVDKHLWKERKRKANVTKEQFDAAWNTQNGCCAICFISLETYSNAHADHDHKTGKFRGILCRHCNHGLGNFLDSPDSCERAAAYLRLHSSPE